MRPAATRGDPSPERVGYTPRVRRLGLGALALLLIACTPSEERVCARKIKLSEDRFGKMDRVSHRKGFLHCIELAKDERAKHPARYKCRADCVLDARHLDEIGECEQACP